jgi:outer membrane receptor for ferrienterochelin and colicins
VNRSAVHRRQLKQRTVVLAVCSLALAAPAAGQQRHDLTGLSLEELMTVEVDTVYGASRYQQRIQDAPASVTVVTREEIAAYGYRSIADALRAVAGFYVSADRNDSFIGVSGLARSGEESGHVLLLLDGHRMNDNVRDLAVVGRAFPVDMDLVDRIEIIRGPSASVYGASASLGVVNIVTRRGADAGTAATVEAGNLGNIGGSVSVGTRTDGGLDVLLSASARQGAEEGSLSFGSAAAANGSSRIAVDSNADRDRRFYAAAAFGGFRVRGLYSVQKEDGPAAQTAEETLPTATFGSRGLIDIQYERTLRAGALTGRAYYDRYRSVVDTNASGAVTTTPDEVRASGDWWGTEMRLITPPGHAHRISAGAEYVRHERRERTAVGNARLPDGFTAAQNGSCQWSLDLQDQWRLAPRLAVNASVRYDGDSRYSGTLSPRVAVMFDVRPGTTVKGVFGRLHRMPSTAEQYGETPTQSTSDSRLSTEDLDAAQLLLDQRVGSRVRVAGGVSISRATNRIGRAADASSVSGVFENLGGVTAKSVDLTVEARTRPNTAPVARLSYSGQWADSVGTAPHHLLSLTGLAPIPIVAARAGLEFLYMSERGTLQGTGLPAFVLVNLNVTRANLLRGLDVSFGVRNLIGTTYALASDTRSGVLYREGRAVSVKLAYRFN